MEGESKSTSHSTAGRAHGAGGAAVPHPTYKSMSPPMRLTLAFVAANAFAAAASLVLFPAGLGAGFFWELTPSIGAAMFGALYLAAGLLVARAAVGGLWESARYLAPMVAAFSAMMLLATFLHLDRFDGGAKLLYWLAVYATALVAAILFYHGHERGGASWKVGQRTPTAVRAAALAVGALAAAFAVVGYAAPGLVMGAWPWELTPLTARAFLSWVFALAAGLLWVAFDPDRGRTARPVACMLVVTAALLTAMLLLHRQDLGAGSLGVWLFGAGVAGMAALGLFMILSGGGRKSGEVSHE